MENVRKLIQFSQKVLPSQVDIGSASRVITSFLNTSITHNGEILLPEFRDYLYALEMYNILFFHSDNKVTGLSIPWDKGKVFLRFSILWDKWIYSGLDEF